MLFMYPWRCYVFFNLSVLITIAHTITTNVDGKAALKASFAFFWLMGLGWIFGILLLVDDLLVWQYLFAICMGAQGIFVFTSHLLRNRRIRNALSIRTPSSLSSYRRKAGRDNGTSSSSAARFTFHCYGPTLRSTASCVKSDPKRRRVSISMIQARVATTIGMGFNINIISLLFMNRR